MERDLARAEVSKIKNQIMGSQDMSSSNYKFETDI